MEKILKILLISFVTFSLFSGLNEDLLAAAKAGYSAGVETAIAAGADINTIDFCGRTALIMAVALGYTNTVRLLLDRSADINHVDINENTALMFAAESGLADTVRLLLKMDAHIDHVNQHGNTALILALREGHAEIIKILEEASKIKQLVDNAIQGDLSSHQKFIKKINIDSHEFNLILNRLINKINTKNSYAEMSNIRKMLIGIAKSMAIEFAKHFGFRIKSQDIELPQELVIEYLLSQFLKERLSPINLQIKIPMAYGGSENFLQLVAHEYGELEKKVAKIKEKRAISSRKQTCELM